MDEQQPVKPAPIWPLILVVLNAIIFVGLELYLMFNNRYLRNNLELYSGLHSILNWGYLFAFIFGVVSIIAYFVPRFDSINFNKLKWFSSLSLFITLFALFRLSTDFGFMSSIERFIRSLNPIIFDMPFVNLIIYYLTPLIFALLLTVIFIIIARNNIKKRFIVSLIIISFSFLLTNIGFYSVFRISPRIAINGIFLFYILSYIYFSSAFKKIAEKLNYKKPILAFIPFANLFLLPILAQKNWKKGFLFFIIPAAILLLSAVIFIISPGDFSGFGGLGLIIFDLIAFYIVGFGLVDYFVGPIFKLRNYPSWLSLFFSFCAHNYYFFLFWTVIFWGFMKDMLGSIYFTTLTVFIIPTIISGIIIGLVAWKDRK